MADKEIYNLRDLTYSTWHRWPSIGRYIPISIAKHLVMMDFDFVEYDLSTKEVVLYKEIFRCYNKNYVEKRESAKEVGVYIKQAKKTFFANNNNPNVVNRYDYKPPVYLVGYERSDRLNPTNDKQCDIAKFFVKEVWPEREEVRELLPEEWAKELVEKRRFWRESWDKRGALLNKGKGVCEYGKILRSRCKRL
jgi:hypothetical protein